MLLVPAKFVLGGEDYGYFFGENTVITCSPAIEVQILLWVVKITVTSRTVGRWFESNHSA